MNNINTREELFKQESKTIAIPRGFLANVFTWMFGALALTAVIAYWISKNPGILTFMINAQTGQLNPVGWIVMLAPLGFVLLMSFGYQKLSGGALTLIFIAYSAIMGISFSFIFLAFTSATIFKTFAVTGLTFGVMALLGYTTKTDLSKLGSILMMGLFGIIIAMVVNFFLKSSMLEYIISIIGVLVFTGLIAYDVQKLKRMASHENANNRKLVIMGALTLYLDFINLFLFLLRLFGSRD